MADVERGLSKEGIMTPLKVIALFLSLTEVVLGAATTQTTGGIQVALTSFVIAFPTGVAAAFFAILWDRPWVLYHPADYGRPTDVEAFIMAQRRRPLTDDHLFVQIQRVVRDTLSSSSLATKLAQVSSPEDTGYAGKSISRILNDAAQKVEEDILASSFVTIDSRPLLGKRGRVWQVPYSEHVTVSGLLDGLWLSMRSTGLQPYTYGQIWVLRDAESGRTFTNMGRRWAGKAETEPRYPPPDDRRLKDVGISAGTRLEAVSFQSGNVDESHSWQEK